MRQLLDLFCGAGGCSVGYTRAGFEVTGVDLNPQKNYPYTFMQHDVTQLPLSFLQRFDAIHASPPCQAYTVLGSLHKDRNYVDLVDPIRQMLIEAGLPYIIENVPGSPLINPVKLCGSHFNLGATCRDGIYRQLRRHRLFETNFHVPELICAHSGQAVGVYGHGGGGQMTRGYKGTVKESRDAMDCQWMTRKEVSQAIPPAYTEYIGRYIP